MTRRLVLVRHARAAPSAGSDLLRPLTEDGDRQAREQGLRLRALGPFGPVLCSPAARCVQTAHGLLGGMDRRDEPDVRGDLSESSPSRSVADLAASAPADSILVGHQPGLVDLACSLLKSSALPFALVPATAVVLTREEAASPWIIAQVLPAP